MKKNATYTCHYCHQQYELTGDQKPLFCPFCGKSQLDESVSMPETKVAEPYEIIKSIGKGGMGEVFLAYDPSCGRRIALKKIRSDLIEHPQIRRRFLSEAHITCQLTHPAIIPIYTIQTSPSSIYYTMPFVEGETLKQIIRKTKVQEKKGEKLDHIGGSIPALMRIFVTICQAVAYAHSRGIIHRDLKPENIIVGKYGEVMILDWGLAKLHGSPSEEELVAIDHLPEQDKKNMTRTGKVVGTVAFMAPERALGQPATIQTDIYSLGVILYQLLTLQTPFKRGTLEEFRLSMKNEEWVDPVIAAPYRDVPRMLADYSQRCLTTDLNERYHAVDELIHEVENYIEGRSEWFNIAQLDIKDKDDWEFQENILIADHVAVTRITEETEWVSLMISTQSFVGNTKIEADVCLREECHGVGFLLSIPEETERNHFNEGYCLWLGSDTDRTTRLLRSGVEVVHAPDIFIKHKQWTKIRIEKIEKSIHLYINDVLQFSYIAHIPLIGTHIGLLSRDADYEISPLDIYVGSLNIMVNCLAVPDAFFAQRDYSQALSEYRRIAYSFSDRAEGREAIFRAGLTFIEQAKTSSEKESLLEQALEEFEMLHGTPGAPLEYLGKALVYEALNDDEEEIKCFEMAYRRYPKHPLLPMLQEQIISRMHEVSRKQRSSAYRFILLSVRLFSSTAIDTHTRRLYNSVQKHWESLPFIEECIAKNPALTSLRFAIPLSFWLAKPYTLGEIIDDLITSEQPCGIEIGNALFSLLELNAIDIATSKMEEMHGATHPFEWTWITAAFAASTQSLDEAYKNHYNKVFSTLDFPQLRSITYFLDRAIDAERTDLVKDLIQKIERQGLSPDYLMQIDVRSIHAYLLENDWKQAGEVFSHYPIEVLNGDATPLHFLYGCWLQAIEGKEVAEIHLTGVMAISYPRTWTLGSHYITDILPQKWFEKAFLWEKKALYRQLALFYHCAGQEDKKNHFQKIHFSLEKG